MFENCPRLPWSRPVLLNLFVLGLVLVVPRQGVCDEGEISLSIGPHYHFLQLYNRVSYNLGGVTAGVDWMFSQHGSLRVSIAGEGGGSDFNRNASSGTVGLRVSTLIDPNDWIPYLGLGVYGGILDLGENDFTPHPEPSYDWYLEVRGEFGLHYRPVQALDIGISAFLSGTFSVTGCDYCPAMAGVGFGAGTAVVSSFYFPR